MGPIEPATKLSSPTALRAISAERWLISSVCSPRPHSSSFRREAWKLSVCTTSAPASIIDSCSAWMTSGRCRIERLVALALQPAVVGRRQVVLLERRAHRAVEDDDALANRGQVVAHEAMLPEP